MSTTDAPHTAPFFGLRAGLQLLPPIVTLIAAMCATLAASGAAFMFVYLLAIGHVEEDGFYLRLAIKAVLFSIFTVAALFVFARQMKTFPPRLGSPPLRPSPGVSPALVIVTLLAFAALAFAALGRHPWTAPDELHHLIVARNLAEYGQYASGHPDDKFLHFDSYDSVGPSVILPVALSMRLLEDNFIAARLVMAVMFMAWLAVLGILFRPVVGGRAALAGLLLAGTAIGSIYLARTLYGEVPALLFACTGLIYWRTALQRTRHVPWSILAGIGFGLAVLAKAFMILAVFPFAAVYVFDRFSHRKIRLTHILIPGCGMAAAIVAWAAVTTLAAPETADTGSTIALYRHYLMFGLDSAPTALDWFLARPLLTLVALLGVVSSLPLLLLIRYDPPILVLYLVAALFLFWWAFFTPATTARYLWYTLALAGMLSGPMLANVVKNILDRQRPSRIRLAAFAVLLLILAPGINETWYKIEQIGFGSEMNDEYQLRGFLETQPAEQEIATTSWMAQRSANFFANRHLPLISEEAIRDSSAIVICDRQLEGEHDHENHTTFGTGRYLIVPPAGTTEE